MFVPKASRVIWRMRLVATVLLLAAGASACGSKSSGLAAPAATGASAATASGADAQQLAAYRSCLQDHGADIGGAFGGQRGGAAPGASGASGTRPQRASGAAGFSGAPGDGTPRSTIDPATLQAAQDACKNLQPTGGLGGFGGSGARGASGVLGQQFGAYVSCLADNGVVTASGATGGRGLGSIDRTSTAFTTANEKCKVLLPDGVDPFAGGGARAGRPGDVPTTTTGK